MAEWLLHSSQASGQLRRCYIPLPAPQVCFDKLDIIRSNAKICFFQNMEMVPTVYKAHPGGFSRLSESLPFCPSSILPPKWPHLRFIAFKQ